MCGRVSLHVEDVAELADELEALLGSADRELYVPRFNVAPGQSHWVVHVADGTRVMVPAVWGFDGKQGAFINARSETAHARFANAFRGGRCVVPATGFYEWTTRPSSGASRPARGRSRQPFWYHDSERPTLLLGGLCEETPAGLRFVVLTRAATTPVANVHDRQPLIVPPRELDRWLGASLASVPDFAPPVLTAVPVSRRVSSAVEDGPQCIEAIGPDGIQEGAPAQLSLLADRDELV
jgi:putative SOS response-associated peptidase YedK